LQMPTQLDTARAKLPKFFVNSAVLLHAVHSLAWAC
jgi:hypothetical protein